MGYSSFYNIDLKTVARWNTPRSKRTPKRLARLYAMIYAAIQIFQQWMQFRKQRLYDLSITPQVCYLEKLLNDRWDFTQRRIVIVDGIDKPPTYFYMRDELKPVYLFKRSENKPVYLYTRGESGQITDDFVVRVPMDIDFNMDEMRSLLIIKKLPGIKFKIQRV